MSTLRVNDLVNETGDGAVGFSKGINISSGVVTATTFVGAVTGNVTGNATGLTGTPAVDVGNLTAGIGTFVGVCTASEFATDFNAIGQGTTVDISGVSCPLGVMTAVTFHGNLTGQVTGDASGLTGTPSITVNAVTANDIKVGGAVTIVGNLTVDGTQTIVNTSTLDIADKTVGIGSTTNATDATADGAGIEIYASHSVADNNKTLTWERDTGCFTVSDPFKFKGVVETVSAASTHESGDATQTVLQMDLSVGTIFTYDIPASGNIGVVSFKNVPSDTGVKNAQTVTLITTQNASYAAGAGNTLPASGIGTYCRIGAYEDGAVVTAGVNTSGKVGSASTVTLSDTGSDVDITSFLVDYNGSSNTAATSYKVYVTQNGSFRFGNIGPF